MTNNNTETLAMIFTSDQTQADFNEQMTQLMTWLEETKQQIFFFGYAKEKTGYLSLGYCSEFFQSFVTLNENLKTLKDKD